MYESRTKDSKDNWETPDYFFKALDNIFEFTLDPCASHENHKCRKYYTKENDGLLQDWGREVVFCNPPYNDIAAWVKKCYYESQKPRTLVVMIIPSRTDTKYWHAYVMKALEIWFCMGRVNFAQNGIVQKGCNFPLAIVVFGNRTSDKPPKIWSFEHK